MFCLYTIYTVSGADQFCYSMSAEIPFPAGKSTLPEDDVNSLNPQNHAVPDIFH